jgi:CBS domain containing-hemolysin-like protein
MRHDSRALLPEAAQATSPSEAAAAVVPMAPGVPVGALVLVAVLGILAAALLTAGEAALGRVTRAAAAELVASGRRGATAVQRLAEHAGRAAAAAGYVRVLAEVAAAACITLVVAASFSAWWQVLGVSLALTVLLLGVLVAAAARGLGRSRAAEVLTALAPTLLALSTLAVPAERVRTWRQSGRTPEEAAEEAADELRDMVDRVSESEQIEADERELLQSVFELGRTLTREVMVPRTDMVTLPAEDPLGKALRLFVRSGYSRVPVVGESVDDVVGVLYLKDVLARMQAHPEAADEPARTLVRNPVYVPETKPVDDLMREMQGSSTHMALAVDEFGGIAGLVTIEDCLEEIVGELRDEHDRAEREVEEVGDGVVRVPARLPVDELGELFGLELHDDEVDTAGGLLAKALGKVPIPGAAADVQGLHLVAERAEGRRRRLSTLLVQRLPAESAGEDELAGPGEDAERGTEDRSGAERSGRVGRAVETRPARPADVRQVRHAESLAQRGTDAATRSAESRNGERSGTQGVGP